VAKADHKQQDFHLAGNIIKPGSKLTIDLPVTRLYTHTPIAVPVRVVHGRKPGPKLFISAAIHGDEINGVEIIHRLLEHWAVKRLRGTLLAIPVVNIHGFIHQSRYLPDRRDLNRNFPGSKKGSLAARLAHLFMNEIVKQCDYGIDLHTAAIHRDNLPQIRANLDHPETLRLATAFDVPVLINANLRDGSLREAAAEEGVPMLLYEGGEALRFNELVIRAGTRGIINVMRQLDMLPPSKKSRKKRSIEPIIARSSSWIRAPGSGVLRHMVTMGSRINKNDKVAIIEDPIGEQKIEISAPYEGIVIGRSNLPLVNEGDALLHIARFGEIEEAEGRVEEFQEVFQPDSGNDNNSGFTG
jgi:predicted deacylase